MDLNALVTHVVETFGRLPTATSSRSISTPRCRPIAGDHDRLAQALTNLVSNAVKYSPDGGTITIATRNDGDAAWCPCGMRGSASRPRTWPAFSTASSASKPASPADRRDRARPVHRAGDRPAAWRGYRAVESTPGQGACFSISLPDAPEESHAAAESLAGDSRRCRGRHDVTLYV